MGLRAEFFFFKLGTYLVSGTWVKERCAFAPPPDPVRQPEQPSTSAAGPGPTCEPGVGRAGRKAVLGLARAQAASPFS